MTTETHGAKGPIPMATSVASTAPTTFEGVTGMRFARLVSREQCGSELMLGACWLDPGADSGPWPQEAHETYFVVHGDVEVHWDEDKTNARMAELHAEDAFYMAPGHTYRTRNPSASEPAFIVYSITPAPV